MMACLRGVLGPCLGRRGFAASTPQADGYIPGYVADGRPPSDDSVYVGGPGSSRSASPESATPPGEVSVLDQFERVRAFWEHGQEPPRVYIERGRQPFRASNTGSVTL